MMKQMIRHDRLYVYFFTPPVLSAGVEALT